MSTGRRSVLSAPLAGLTVLAALAGCTGSSADSGPAAPGSPTEAGEQSTAPPPAPLSTRASVEAALRALLPPATAASPLSAAEVRSGLEFAARYVASVYGDRDWLCSADPKASRTTAVATPALAAALRPGVNRSYRFLEPRMGTARGACAAARWESPGVALGPQSFTVAGARGGASRVLRVGYRGIFGYRLVKADSGMAQLWAGDFRHTLVLVRTGTSWRIDTPNENYFAWLSEGWPADIPLPPDWVPATGEGLALPAPTPDPAALTAVRDGVAATLRTGRASSELRLTGVRRAGKPAVSTLSGLLSPRRGEADLTLRAAGFAPLRRLVLAGHDQYEQLHDPVKVYAAPGESKPAGAVWSVQDSRTVSRRVDANLTPVDGSPFVTLALAAAAGSAGPTNCPTEVRAARCLLASTDLAELARGTGTAAAFAYNQLTQGVPELRLGSAWTRPAGPSPCSGTRTSTPAATGSPDCAGC